VAALNLATPLDFILENVADFRELDPSGKTLLILGRLSLFLALIAAVMGLTFWILYRLLQPIRFCFPPLAGKDPKGDPQWARARRRLLNLPFLLIPVNVLLWMLTPAAVFAGLYWNGRMDLHTATAFSIRASMVGLISSALAFYRIEAYLRRECIPFFFPSGRLSRVTGAAQISISRRIRMFYRLGSLIPMVILVLTLLTLQWEVGSSALSAREYGRGILIFTLVLTAVVLFAGGELNRLVARSIVQPLENMLGVIGRIRNGDYDARIQVMGNDEIGVLGDAGNAMIRGLAERETIRNAFGRYVTPEIRDEIIAGNIPLNGERREATVLFSDLRNFTPYVESRPPEEVIADMRAYFTAMHRAIRRHNGLVLQFVGDEIEAVFGVPVEQPDAAEAAVKAALDMQQALASLNRERTAAGRTPFAHGIGIHSGPVLAGNTGSEEQSAYALIGDTVNTASRIQGLTRALNADVLISEQTRQLLKGEYSLERQAPRQVKGVSKPVVVYRLAC
jgi:class 3 adenylate cyclase